MQEEQVSEHEKAQQVLDSRREMIKVPSRVAVHIDIQENIVVTFSDDTGKETYSFMMTNEMAKSVVKGLTIAGNTKQNKRLH